MSFLILPLQLVFSCEVLGLSQHVASGSWRAVPWPWAAMPQQGPGTSLLPQPGAWGSAQLLDFSGSGLQRDVRWGLFSCLHGLDCILSFVFYGGGHVQLRCLPV